MRNIGLVAALTLAASSFAAAARADGFWRDTGIDLEPRGRRIPATQARLMPNDFGPVIDSTPESKRAKRRRLARSRAA